MKTALEKAWVSGLVSQPGQQVTANVNEVTGEIEIFNGATNTLAAAGVARITARPVQSLATSDLQITAVSNESVEFPNPYAGAGKANAPVHPSPLVFDRQWNGYKYWMAYTPYPGKDSQYENPCVAASNDLQTWTARGAQPLAGKPADGYNADTHLFMSPDGLTMYLAYRERLTAAATNNLKLMHTTDGVTWSAPVTIMTGSTASQDFASPSIWWNGTAWTMVFHNLDASFPNPVQRRTSVTADPYGAWNTISTVTIPPYAGRQWWHSFHAKLPNKQIIALLQDNPVSGQPGFLYWAESEDDGVSYTITGHAIAGVGVRSYRSGFIVEPTPAGPVVNIFYGDFEAPKVLRHIATTGLQNVRAAYRARHAMYLGQGTSKSAECLWADTFDRADSATAIGTPSGGGAYSVASGTWGIRNNQAYAVASGKVLASGSTANHEVQVRVSSLTGNVQQWIVARSVDGSNCWRLGTYSNAAGLSILVLQSVVAGGIVINKECGVFLQGDIIALRCTGVVLEVMVNGVVQHTEISGVHKSGTGFGLQSNNGATSNYDSLVVLAA